MPVVFDEVTAEVEPPNRPPAEEQPASQRPPGEPCPLHLRREWRRLEERQARLQAD